MPVVFEQEVFFQLPNGAWGTRYVDPFPEINVQDYNPINSGAAIQEAIDESCGDADPATTVREATKKVEIPEGLYLIEEPINVRSVIGLEFEGSGDVELRANSNMSSVLDINGACECSFGGFRVTGTPGVQVDNGIFNYWELASSLRSSTRNVFHDIEIRNLDYFTGMQIGKVGTGGAQVDNTEYRNLFMSGGWTTGNTTRWQNGLRLGNGTAGNNYLHHGYALNLIGNRHNLYVDNSGIDVRGAGFGGGEIDVFTGITGYISLNAIRSETSERFLVTGGPTTAGLIISVTDLLWQANAMNADGEWIRLYTGGGLEGRSIAVGNAAVIPKIAVGFSGGSHARCVIDGFQVGGTIAPVAVESLFIINGNSSVDVRGYTAVNSSGSTQYVQDYKAPLNTQTGTTYTFVMRDHLLPLNTFSNASPIAATIPPNSTTPFPIGAQIPVMQLGAGQVTMTPGAGVTINATPGAKTRAQNSIISAIKRATDTWVLSGDLAA